MLLLDSNFPYVEKWLACDVVLDNGHVLRRGQRLQFDLHSLNQNGFDGLSHNFTWGFGRRRCPGAQAGRHIVSQVQVQAERGHPPKVPCAEV